jgi:hypothetical protein
MILSNTRLDHNSSKRANKGIIATTSSFSRDATLFAKQEKYKLNLSDYTVIKGWLKAIK